MTRTTFEQSTDAAGERAARVSNELRAARKNLLRAEKDAAAAEKAVRDHIAYGDRMRYSDNHPHWDHLVRLRREERETTQALAAQRERVREAEWLATID